MKLHHLHAQLKESGINHKGHLRDYPCVTLSNNFSLYTVSGGARTGLFSDLEVGLLVCWTSAGCSVACAISHRVSA